MLNTEALFDKFGKVLPSNSLIFCEYEPGNDFYLILNGQVKISKIVNDREKTLDILEEGDIFGEMAILEEQPRSASATTMTEVRLLHFNRANFEILMKGNPALALKLLAVFSKRIYDAKRRLMILLLPDVQAKVADVLVMLAEREHKSLDEMRQVILKGVQPLDLANWCGRPVDEVEKVANGFIKQGKLELYSDRIVINNIRDFQRIVNQKRKADKFRN